MLPEDGTRCLSPFLESQGERIRNLPVYLFPFSEDDLPFVIELFGEEDVLKGVTRSALDTPEKITSWISGVHERDDCLQFMILLADNNPGWTKDFPTIKTIQLEEELVGVPVGLVTLKDIDKDGNKAATVGIAVTGRAQGKGVGLERLIDFCKNCLRDSVNTLNAEIYMDNISSVALFSRLGFFTDGNILEKDERACQTWSLLL